MVHCNKLVPQRNVCHFQVSESVHDIVNRHILRAISLLVDDKESEVMSADAQTEFMKRGEIPRVPRQERQAVRSRIKKVQRVMIARAAQRSR